MRRALPSAGLAYAAALAATGAAVLLRWLLDPWLGDDYAFVTIIVAVAAAVWYGGVRAALLATVVGLAACVYLFVPDRGAFGISRASDGLGLVLNALTCFVVIGFGQALRRARRLADERREALRVTLASIGDAVITTDVHGRITSLNFVAETLTRWTSAEAVGRPMDEVFRIVNEQTGEPAPNPVARVLADGRARGLANHTALVARDGTLVPIDDSAAPIRDAQGRILGVVLIFRDVTARRAAERAQSSLAMIVESSDDAIIGKDVNGIVTSWNRAAERLFGYPAGEVVGRPIAVLEPPERAGEMEAILARIRRGERIEHFDTVRRAKDGHLVPVSLTISPIKNEYGEIVGASKTARDVSEHRKAQEALREAAQRAEADLAAMGRLRQVGALCAEPGRPFAECLEEILDAAIALTGADRGNIQIADPSGILVIAAHRGLSQPFLDYFGAIEREDDSVCAAAMGAGARVVVEDVTRSELFSGKPALEILLAAGVRAVQSTPLTNSAGQLLGMLSTHFDRPHGPSERELRFLDLLVRQAGDYLERKRNEDALRESDRRKDEFLATLAHELRNPLAPIRNAVQVLLLKGSPEPELEWSREVIDRQVRHMARLLDDLLDVSRISHDKLDLRSERIALGTVLQNAIETSRPLLDAARVEFTVDLPREPVYVDADQVRLSQVFSNLLNNSAKFTQPGGHVRLRLAREANEALLSVTDDGSGIPAELLPRVFDIFSQARQLPERAHGGLGIGLSLARGLVELHGGTIEARSEGPDKGTEMVVRLPLAVGDAPPVAPHRVSDGWQQPVVSRRLLIVDDLRDSADSLATLCRLMGHDVRTAYDGTNALGTAEEFRPDVVLLDIGMPGLSGYDACRYIREQPWGREMYLVALTGWGQETDRRRTEEAGFDQHLVKPVHSADLMQLLATLPSTPEYR